VTTQPVAVRVAFAIAAFAIVGAAQAQPSTNPQHAFVGLKKCGSCHGKELIGDQVAAWRKDPHAHSYQTLLEERSQKLGAARGIAAPPAQAPECLACHVTAAGVGAARLAFPPDSADGVQCESCHGPGKDFREKKIMSDHDKAVAKGLWEASKDEKICTACHNSASPTWDPKRFALPGGKTAPFDFAVAKAAHTHPIPKDVKGKFLELEKKQKAAKGEHDDDEEDE
jgi:hypothetical protein